MKRVASPASTNRGKRTTVPHLQHIPPPLTRSQTQARRSHTLYGSGGGTGTGTPPRKLSSSRKQLPLYRIVPAPPPPPNVVVSFASLNGFPSPLFPNLEAVFFVLGSVETDNAKVGAGRENHFSSLAISLLTFTVQLGTRGGGGGGEKNAVSLFRYVPGCV